MELGVELELGKKNLLNISMGTRSECPCVSCMGTGLRLMLYFDKQ